ncbi:TSC22 domain family protein 2 isoform X2 [Macrotis lagotis]|uniref:TSC22 domain family protein 2 isoform X2 n=1 Tax=Macrotis lagotis TaxID=92651 RepID=UPI003D68A373
MSKMPAKKKSCFQITSVTSAQVASGAAEDTESLDDPDESRTEDVSSDILDASRATDYGPEGACERSSSEETLSAAGEADTPGAASPNPLPDGRPAAGAGAAAGGGRGAAGPPHGSASAPAAAAAAASSSASSAAAAACGSRFRVIKLDHGSGEPYRRGRWTCTEYYDADGAALSRTGDCIRHGAAPEPGPERDSGLGATGGSSAQAAQGPDPGGDGGPAQPPPGTPPPPFGAYAAGRPGPADYPAPRAAEPGAPPAPASLPQAAAGHAPADETRRKSEPLPQPPLALLADGQDPLASTPMNSLASSVFGIAIPVDGEEDSASGASVVAIDNKIEQAMDLVKSHLMYAVREEVEVLKEQIKELVERNSLLERENALLKSLSNNDQLSQLSTQQANPSSTSQQQTVIAQPPQPTQPPQQPNVSSA